MELFGLRRIPLAAMMSPLGSHDVAKSAQAMALLGAKTKLLCKPIALVRCSLGVEAEQSGRCSALAFSPSNAE
jgi:hypothetical protein